MDKFAEYLQRTQSNTTLTDFFDNMFSYVFTECCSCPNKECNVTSKLPLETLAPAFLQKFRDSGSKWKSNEILSQKCNKIHVNEAAEHIDEYAKDSETIITIVLSVLTRFNLITPRNRYYYILNGHKMLSWKNLKSLDAKDSSFFYSVNKETYEEIFEYFIGESPSTVSKNHHTFATLVQLIFWYVRKLAVDTLIAPILYAKNVEGISVGSTSLTSDYDITLYGESFKSISYVIREFNEYFEKLFKNTSSIVFDTNIYGVSFINVSDNYNVETESPTKERINSTLSFLNFDDDDFNFFEYRKNLKPGAIECGKKKFKFVDSNRNTVVSQHIWALIKLFLKLEVIQDNNSAMYALLYHQLEHVHINFSKLLSVADEFINIHTPNLKMYDNSIQILKRYKNQNKNSAKIVSDEDFNNFISYVNFNGSETYFSRGTFLHVVVNLQMCQNTFKSKFEHDERLVLTTDEYLDSFIENMADLLQHYNKKKYLDRAIDALEFLELTKIQYNEVKKRLEQIDKLREMCDISILKCSSFLLMNLCMECIVLVANECFANASDNEIEKGIEIFRNFVDKLPDHFLNQEDDFGSNISFEDSLSKSLLPLNTPKQDRVSIVSVN